MTTIILTWNPTKSELHHYDEHIAATKRGETSRGNRSTGRTKNVAIGDPCFLLRLGVPDRGIVASGRVASEVFHDEDWNPDSSGRSANYVEVEWEKFVEPEDRLPTEHLEREIPDFRWHPQSSGTRLRDLVAEARLQELWEQHISKGAPAPPGTGGLDGPVERCYTEGGLRVGTETRYERNAAARKACLAHHGTKCVVCEFSFKSTYGDLGEGFIHVHHLNDLALAGAARIVDPKVDLVPVCANCHAMLHHRAKPARSIEDLRACIESQKLPPVEATDP